MHITNDSYDSMSALILDTEKKSSISKSGPESSSKYMAKRYEVMSLEEKARIIRYRQQFPMESSYKVADHFTIEFCKKVNARAVQSKYPTYFTLALKLL